MWTVMTLAYAGDDHPRTYVWWNLAVKQSNWVHLGYAVGWRYSLDLMEWQYYGEGITWVRFLFRIDSATFEVI